MHSLKIKIKNKNYYLQGNLHMLRRLMHQQLLIMHYREILKDHHRYPSCFSLVERRDILDLLYIRLNTLLIEEGRFLLLFWANEN